jgi:hypothetical protein
MELPTIFLKIECSIIVFITHLARPSMKRGDDCPLLNTPDSKQPTAGVVAGIVSGGVGVTIGRTFEIEFSLAM